MKILGYDYKLIADPWLDCMGACQPGSLTIKFDARIPPQQQESTVLHEVIEALNYHLRLTLSEEQIRGIEAGLYQVCGSAGIDLKPLLADVRPAEAT